MDRKNTVVVGASSICAILFSLNIWFVNRLVNSIDDNIKAVKELQSKVYEIDSKVAVFGYALNQISNLNDKK